MNFQRLSLMPNASLRTCVTTLLTALAALDLAQAQIAVQGETIHTVTGATIRDGVVVIRDGKIAAVGPAASTPIPAGFRVVQAKVVTPGLIDAHSTVGISGMLNQKQDQDQLDKSSPIQPELRGVDSYNPLDPLVDWMRSLGITTLHTGPGPGALISGQSLVVKTAPQNLQAATLIADAVIVGNIGPEALSASKDKAPSSIAKSIAMLRAEFTKAQEYQRKMGIADVEKRPSRDLHLEALAGALEMKKPVMITVQRHQDILAALRLAEEFHLRLILDGAADAEQVLEPIRKSGSPVILHPTMARAEDSLQNSSMGTAAALQKAGILFALQSGFEGYVPKSRVVLFEAAIAASHGLPADQALAAITFNAARILGLDHRLGSIEPGKDADLALFDGDPFEYTTHCTGTVVSGALVHEGAK
jgi:imidazolonepropionase-like amidohydrolase